ncbi:MAG TPA: hypothetical protein VF384_08465 [Planctomycetota bacterium]
MKRIHQVAICSALALASCGEPGTAADGEVAAELRALRAVLVQQQKSGAGAQSPVAADRGQITAALQPLREVLDGLLQSQRELQARQVSLTQEMQRWSQLLVETASGAKQDEAKALAQRLQQLEKTLQEQDTRHRQVEGLMQGALERTADRLEEFLRRLEGVRPETQPPPNPGGTPAGTPPIKSPNEPASGGNGPVRAGSAEPATGGGQDDGKDAGGVAAVRAPRSWSVLWWLLPAVLASGLCVVFWLRLRSVTRSPAPAATTPRDGREPAEASRELGVDRSVEEIWAAAALLGEAVDRLKQNAAPAAIAPQPAAPAVQAVPAIDTEGVDLAAIKALELAPAKPAAPPAPPVAPAAMPSVAEPAPPVRLPLARTSHVTVGPPRNTVVRCRLPGAHGAPTQSELLRLLAEDPRVLRRPEPVMTANANAVEVAFQVLPGLPASERSQIEQRLRDALD